MMKPPTSSSAPSPAPEMAETSEPSKGLAIPIPDGFEAPEGSDKDISFDVLATVKMVDGKLMLEALDGIPLPADADAQEEAAEGDFMSAIEQGLADSGKEEDYEA